MKLQHKTRWGSAVGVAVGVAVLGMVAGCGDEPSTAQASRTAQLPRRLVVITPHNEKIREAFAVNFSNWSAANGKGAVEVDWIVHGTPRCVEYIEQLATLPREEAPRAVPDLMFGGGVADHELLATRGRTLPVALNETPGGIPAEVAGIPTRDTQDRWHATGLTSFGILFNEESCRRRNITLPHTWTDLAEPRFFGWIGLADPIASGSNRECMTLILHRAGWAEGYGTLIRILANARALGDRSTDVLKQVDSGVLLAAFAVNFDGQDWAAASNGRLSYINPPAATAVSPDVISVLTTAQNPEIARDFVRFVLSEEGQALWGVEAQHRPSFGQTLYHYPILPSTYEKFSDKLAVQENPLVADFGVRMDIEKTRRIRLAIVPLVAAVSGENHVLLQQAWGAVIRADMSPTALQALLTPPFDEAAAMEFGVRFRDAEAEEAQELLEEWKSIFSAKFRHVLELARG